MGDFDGNSFDDLAVGVVGEDVGTTIEDQGAVNVIYGAVSVGLTSSGSELLHEDTQGVLDRGEDFDYFGAELPNP